MFGRSIPGIAILNGNSHCFNNIDMQFRDFNTKSNCHLKMLFDLSIKKSQGISTVAVYLMCSVT